MYNMIWYDMITLLLLLLLRDRLKWRCHSCKLLQGHCIQTHCRQWLIREWWSHDSHICSKCQNPAPRLTPVAKFECSTVPLSFVLTRIISARHQILIAVYDAVWWTIFMCSSCTVFCEYRWLHFDQSDAEYDKLQERSLYSAALNNASSMHPLTRRLLCSISVHACWCWVLMAALL